MPIIYKTIILDRKTGEVKERKSPVNLNEEELQQKATPLYNLIASQLSKEILANKEREVDLFEIQT